MTSLIKTILMLSALSMINTTAQSASGTAADPEIGLSLSKTVDLSFVSSDAVVTAVAFSHGNTLLAIAINPAPGKTDIVVWDLAANRLRSHIHSPFAYGMVSGTYQLMWRADDQAISFGDQRSWDPLSGKENPDIAVKGNFGRMNPAGDRLVTRGAELGRPATAINVLDIRTGSTKVLDMAGPLVRSAVWVSDHLILATLVPTAKLVGKPVDGFEISGTSDVGFRVVDAVSGKVVNARWFAGGRPAPASTSSISGDLSAGSAVGVASVGSNGIFDTRTMALVEHTPAQELKNAPAGGGQVFLPDGSHLFIKGIRGRNMPAHNAIVSVSSGRKVGSFPGGNWGIDVSHDGKLLAYGDDASVKIHTITKKK